MLSQTFTYLLVLLVAQLAVMSKAQAFEKRQGPNTIYNDYPSLQTAFTNGSISVIPIPRTLAQTLVGRRKLLPPTGLPEGFLKPDEHILTISSMFQTDIRQKALVDLRVDVLSTVGTSIPFVDGAKDGKTPFAYGLGSYVAQLLPSVVATVQGHKDTYAHIEPSKAAYAQITDTDYLLQVFVGLDNPLDGPGLLTPVVQNRFRKSARGKLSARHFKELLSQRVLRPNGRCDEAILNFDIPFAAPFFAKADIQTGSPVTRTPLTFKNVESYYTGYEWAYPALGQDCKKLAQKVVAQKA